MEEIWRIITWSNGRYSVSNLGRIKLEVISGKNNNLNTKLMEEKAEMPIVYDNGKEVSVNFFSSEANFNLGQRMAKVFATSNLVPAQYQNNIGNCLIGLNIASRMGADPLMVFQNLVIVHNQPTFEAKFAIACFNATGKYTPIRYTEIGKRGTDSWGMYAYAIDKSTGDVLKGPEITIALAKAEGWYNQNAKWRNVPQLMLRYRAASWFIRTTDPGVMMGFQTTDEVEDVKYEEVPINTPSGVVPQDNANKEAIDMEAAEAQAEAEHDTAHADAQQTAETARDEGKKPEVDKALADEKKPQEKPSNAAKTENKPKASLSQDAQPMGAQPTPDLFK